MYTSNHNRIKLLLCDEPILNIILEGNDAIEENLQLKVPQNWTEFGDTAFKYALTQIQHNPESRDWWTYLPVLKEGNVLLGSCGYKGPPDENGRVEIGYEIAQSFRNRGYATETTRLLIQNAFENEAVSGVLAHTLAEENASVKVLKKCGFNKVQELPDPEVGTVWQWFLRKVM